jgi:iron complex outermembrane receptor protein
MRLAFILLISVGALVGISVSNPVRAQSSSTTPALTPAAQEDSLATIVVTANKREENADKVGLTLTVLSGEELAARRINSLSDIASAVPGLTYSPSTTNTPIFTLRGVGFNESSLGVYPAVSVYVDQAPLPFPVMASHEAFDLERIEVLKGPQGTLFGQNSTGGAINYIAAKPTSSFEAGGDVSYGRFNQIDTNAYVSGPITPTLGYRVAITGLQMNDWQYSVTRDDTNGHQSYVAGRGLLDWRATDDISFELNFNGFVDNSQPQAQQLIAINPQRPADASAVFLASVFTPNNARAADWAAEYPDPATGVVGPNGAVTPGTEKLGEFDPFSDRNFYQIALRGDFSVIPGASLTSLTSYDYFNQTQRTNGDGNAMVTFDLQKNDGYIHSFNQEVRLANEGASTFRWVVGGNYESSRTYEDQLLRFYGNSNYNPETLYINAAGVSNLQEIQNLAGFGNLEYDVLDKLTVRGGVRYTDSKNKANICPYTITGGNVDKLFNVLGGLVGDVPFTPVGPSNPDSPNSCYALDNLTMTIPGQPDNVPGRRFEQSLNENNVSWKFGTDYRVLTNALIYANVSRGFKAGSFPSLAASDFTALEPVRQEELTAYETGIKTQLFDHTLLLNASTFYYDYKNKQVRGKLSDPIFGALDALVNVPKSRIIGAEADVTVRPITGLTLGASLTYLDSKVVDFTNAVDTTGKAGVNFDGVPLPFTPRWAGTFNGDYSYPAPGGAVIAGFTVTQRAASDAVLGAQKIDVQAIPTAVVRSNVGSVYGIEGYGTVDVRLGYQSEQGKWSVGLWGKNVLNKYYWTTVIPASDSAARLAGLPATYGITFGYKY